MTDSSSPTSFCHGRRTRSVPSCLVFDRPLSVASTRHSPIAELQKGRTPVPTAQLQVAGARDPGERLSPAAVLLDAETQPPTTALKSPRRRPAVSPCSSCARSCPTRIGGPCFVCRTPTSSSNSLAPQLCPIQGFQDLIATLVPLIMKAFVVSYVIYVALSLLLSGYTFHV